MSLSGPNKAMLGDFWRMVWQEKVTKIVMLTNLVETCKVTMATEVVVQNVSEQVAEYRQVVDISL